MTEELIIEVSNLMEFNAVFAELKRYGLDWCSDVALYCTPYPERNTIPLKFQSSSNVHLKLIVTRDNDLDNTPFAIDYYFDRPLWHKPPQTIYPKDVRRKLLEFARNHKEKLPWKRHL